MTCPLKARVVDPEETDVARKRLGNHAFAATYAHNKIKTVGGGVFCAFHAEGLYTGDRTQEC
jgi:hypothetical protein